MKHRMEGERKGPKHMEKNVRQEPWASETDISNCLIWLFHFILVLDLVDYDQEKTECNVL